MFKGLGLAMAVVTAFLLLLPAMVLWAEGGADWFKRLQLMTPLL